MNSESMTTQPSHVTNMNDVNLACPAMRNTAFFCIADGLGYLPKVIVALLSVKRFHPDASYFVVGRFRDDDEAIAISVR